MDTVSAATRSRMMRAVRGTNTKPELVVRRMAHRLGFRFRLHRRDLPGTPDLVFPRLGLVLLVHGCFFHRHPGCRFTTTPASNREFWHRKFVANVERDARVSGELRELGWRVEVVWECETRAPSALERHLFRLLRRAAARADPN